MTKAFIFGAAYGAPPIFDPNVESMGHVDFDELSIPIDLLKAIIEWDKQFQMTFVEYYPPFSGFRDPEMIQKHNDEGKKLASDLQLELGVNFDFRPVKV